MHSRRSSIGANVVLAILAAGMLVNNAWARDRTPRERVLYSFTGNLDGGFPLYGKLFRDGAGNLYGTTSAGGASGSGAVFRVSPAGKETAIAFTGKTAGFPAAGLVPGDAGVAYGTTEHRGTG